MTDFVASIGLQQLKKIDQFIENRKHYAKIYERELQDLNEIILPNDSSDQGNVRHLYPILLRLESLKVTRDKFVAAIQKENIGVGVHYPAIHLQKYFREKFNFQEGDYPNAEFVSERVPSLPLFAQMNVHDVQDTIEAVRKLVAYYKK